MNLPPSNIGTLTIDGRKYAVIPLEEYEQAKAEMLFDEPIVQDLGDIAELERRKDEPTVPWEQVKKDLGLK